MAPPVQQTPGDDPVYTLGRAQSSYFEENHGVGSQLTELRPDGTYRTIAREHMGVAEDDAGRWRQASNGALLFCSEYQFRFVQAGPLWVVVANQSIHDQLPALRDAIRARLAAHADAGFAPNDLEWPFGGEDYSRPSIDVEVYDRNVTRAELEALARAIDAYMASGDENFFWTTPRIHRGIVYLDASWQIPSRTHDAEYLYEVHRDIEHHVGGLALLAIDEARFRESIRSPQPFVFHTEMNDCVGRALRDAPLESDRPRVEPRCKSFTNGT